MRNSSVQEKTQRWQAEVEFFTDEYVILQDVLKNQEYIYPFTKSSWHKLNVIKCTETLEPNSFQILSIILNVYVNTTGPLLGQGNIF